MKWVHYIPTPPFKFDFMMIYRFIWMHTSVYRAQQQGYGHPLQLFVSIKLRKESKPHGENPPSRKDKAHNLNNMSSTYIYFHLKYLNELLLGEILNE